MKGSSNNSFHLFINTFGNSITQLFSYYVRLNVGKQTKKPNEKAGLHLGVQYFKHWNLRHLIYVGHDWKVQLIYDGTIATIFQIHVQSHFCITFVLYFKIGFRLGDYFFIVAKLLSSWHYLEV